MSNRPRRKARRRGRRRKRRSRVIPTKPSPLTGRDFIYCFFSQTE
jgi:hypothetical protein